MGEEIECEVCGGTDFHKEAGHFYCNECQTQSQQIQEHVFEDEVTNTKLGKKIQKEKTTTTADKLTSWECYNYILKGLTEELINLGAKPELKEVVKCLWMKYLHQCEVFDFTCDRPPKVSVIGSKRDIKILFNIKKRKRRRSTSSVSTIGSERRERSRKTRALIKTQYDELSQSQSFTQDASLDAETLSNLKSDSEKSGTSSRITYNRHSNAELKKMMSKKHINVHKTDVEGEMGCHKFTTKDFRRSFCDGPSVLSLVNVYCIIYLGLLIIEDDIQLGDFLRFIREGHVSYGNYKRFFDEESLTKVVNWPTTHGTMFASNTFRQKAAKLAQFIEVTGYVQKPNLVKLARRYCEELDLPEEIFDCVRRLILRSPPGTNFTKTSKQIPNYEGRAMCYVIFVLKLLFGLDGCTENKFSDYAKKLDKIGVEPRMFDIEEWLKKIGLRDVLVRKYHVPSAVAHGDRVDPDLYLRYIENQEFDFRIGEKKIQSEVKDYRELFQMLFDKTPNNYTLGYKFQSTLTPFTSYIDLIISNEQISNKTLLSRSFKNDSINFLLRPNKYLRLVNNEKVNSGGANVNIVTEDPMYMNETGAVYQRNKKPVYVKIEEEEGSGDKFVREFLDQENRRSLKTSDVNVLLSNWLESHREKFERNREFMEDASRVVQVPDIDSKETYREHFTPHERYWLNIPANPTIYISNSDMEDILKKSPISLRIIFKECARIIDQNIRDFYSEFLISEICLVYCCDFHNKGKKKVNCVGAEFRGLVKKCAQNW